jgi:hypothetical protein
MLVLGLTPARAQTLDRRANDFTILPRSGNSP